MDSGLGKSPQLYGFDLSTDGVSTKDPSTLNRLKQAKTD